MRLHFPTTTRPKKAAKHIASHLSVSLSLAQRAIARGCGYRDWHDLESEISAGLPCPLDQDLSVDDYVERQKTLILTIAADLGAPHGDVQYALSDARLTGDRQPLLEEQIDIRVACWRANDLPFTGARKLGAVGVLKSPGRNGEVVIVKSSSRDVTKVLSQRGLTEIVDHEFVAPRQPRSLFIPMRLYLPYGYWTEADGAKVLFSRDYHPLWRLRDNHAPERIEPWIRIKIVEETWLWNDASIPWEKPKIKAKMIDFLRRLDLHKLPILADALPLIIHDNYVYQMSEGAKFLKENRDKKEIEDLPTGKVNATRKR